MNARQRRAARRRAPWADDIFEELRLQRDARKSRRRERLHLRWHAQCPRCGGHGLELDAHDYNCTQCEGSGWVSKGRPHRQLDHHLRCVDCP